jgi:hypothetical protein
MMVSFQFSAKTPRRQDAKMSEPSLEHDLLAPEIVDAAFAVHTILGLLLGSGFTSNARDISLRRVRSRSSGRLRCRGFTSITGSTQGSGWTSLLAD